MPTIKTYEVQILRKENGIPWECFETEGFHKANEKVKAKQFFPTPMNFKTFRSLLGVSGFYTSFIKQYSTIAKPQTQLTGKDTLFEWSEEHEKAF